MGLIIQHHFTLQRGGRFGSECPADLLRNQWPISNGMGGRIRSESVADLERNLQLDRELEETGEKSSEVMQLKSIPGVGTKLSSRLAGEIGDIRRFNRESQLAVYCGVACIDDDSGKSKKTKAVYKANRICKATMIEIAGCTIRYVQESKAYYEKKRAEGKEHNHALRCLARQLIKVIFKMLTENRGYICKEELKKAA